MPNLNKLFIMGHITRNPELKYTTKGVGVCKLGVAVNDDFNKEKVSFFNVTAFDMGNRKLAEIIESNFNKGDAIFLEGKMEQDRWEDKEGNKRVDWNMIVNDFKFLGGKKKDGKEEEEKTPF